MRKFIRKYYQEIVAVLLIAGFWGGMWGYHAFQTQQAKAFQDSNTLVADPNLANK